MRKPTPGPWSVAEETFDNGGITEIVIRGSDPRAAVAVALDFGKNNPGWQLANARLIAEAPELLESLIYLRDCAESGEHPHGPRWAKALAPIKKAQGET